MKVQKLFEDWNLTGLKIKLSFLEMDWKPNTVDQNAAWDLYVELLTRVTTQALQKDEGTEEAALNSIHKLFDITRNILKFYGRDCVSFSKVAIIILNQVIRPFTSKWHRIFEAGDLTTEQKNDFRTDLASLQVKLTSYAQMLASIADVEDITELNNY